MKKKTYLFALMAMALTLGSCSDNENGIGGETSKYITVSTSIGNMTRVATDANGGQTFEEGDEISVYAWTGDATVAPETRERVVNNAINKLTNGSWVSTPQMLWKNNRDKHYFIGVYPTAAISDLSAGEYTFDETKQVESDLLVAVNKDGLSYNVDEQQTVPLIFTHIMAKLVVNLTYKNQWGTEGPTVDKVAVGNAAKKATVNYLTKVVTPSAVAEDNLSQYPNSLTVGKSDYLKLSMVSLRYRVPPHFLRKTLPFVKYATLAFQGSNLFTWTSYKESDPESGTLAGSMQPIYTFNMSLTF